MAKVTKKQSAGRKAVQQVRAPRKDEEVEALTRVTRETEVRGTETRVERLVEHAPKPTLTGVDRTGSRGRYVYCIIRSSTPLKFGAIGMDDQWAEVYAVNYKDMAAVVSDVLMVPLDSTRENVLAHERVNEIVMRDHTVIPMSFGTIFKTRDDILELLKSAYDAFNDVLNKMQDKLEFGLKVLWDRDDMVRVIEGEDEDIHRLKTEISSQKGSTYFARMQYGRLDRRRPADPIGALCRRVPREAAGRVGRVAHQPRHRRQDDHERRVPRPARAGAGIRPADQADRVPVRQADVQIHWPMAPV